MPLARSPALDCYDDIRDTARRRLPKMVYDFVEGGAGGEVTLRANRAAFERTLFNPHWLTDVSKRDTSTTVLGESVSMPILLAPTGLAGLSHWQGELSAARAAGAAGTIFTVSTSSSYSLEAIAAVAMGPLWFQLYLWQSLAGVESLVRRAATAGYKALVLTIDVPVVGIRERDLRNRTRLPPRITAHTVLGVCRRPRWLYGYARGPKTAFGNLQGGPDYPTRTGDPSATWERLSWLRRIWSGPLVVKGVLSPQDAARAVRCGADAVYVSNHGGRQLDTCASTLDVLADVVAAVGDAVEVYLDGGVRSGADAVKARALGARACLVGRPWVLSLAADGCRGVERLLDLLRVGVDNTLALVGVPHLDDVDREILLPAVESIT